MDTRHLTLLAIDDNPENLTTLCAVLADLLPGAKVLTAANGLQGLELAETTAPDVILLDIVMPQVDGYTVCRALKQNDRLSDIPVLFLSSLRIDRNSRIKALEAGAEGFIATPFDEIELGAQIRSMAKIKAANRLKREELNHLAAMVSERTRELERELAERKRAEQALRESEEKFKALFEQSGDYQG
jgi:CheY-like chemotaxis protein